MRALCAVFVVAGLFAGPGAASAMAAFSFTVEPAAPTEGGQITVTVNRSSVLDPTTVTVKAGAPGDTATPGTDYTAGPYTVTFPNALDMQESIFVNTQQDSLDEADETVTFSIDGVGAYTRTIVDDDPSPVIAIGNASVAEGTGAGTTVLSFPVSLSTASARAVSATFATADVTGGATAGQDYNGGTGTVSIPAGQKQGTIQIGVIRDDIPEADETLTVTLTNPVNATLGATSTATGTIVNDDTAPTLSISGPGAQKEGTGAQTPFSFAIELSRPYSQPVTVAYSTNDGTATAPADFVATEQTVTLPAGQARMVVTVPVIGDAQPEPDETFAVSLSPETSGLAVTTGEATATIVNDDLAVVGAGAGGAAGQQVPAAGVAGARGSGGDETPPRVKLSKITSSGGVMKVTVSCPTGESVCRGTMTVFSVPARTSKVKALRGEVKLASSLFVIKGGEQARLTLRPSRRAAGLIRRAGRLRARGFAVARDAAGNIASVQTTGIVRARR